MAERDSAGAISARRPAAWSALSTCLATARSVPLMLSDGLSPSATMSAVAECWIIAAMSWSI